MSFDFNKYETVARNLCVNPTEENIRAAVSRAYYCIFHKAQKLASNSIGAGGTHEKLIRDLEQSKKLKYGLRISKLLNNLRQDRVYADYYAIPPHPTVINDNFLKSFWSRFDMLSEWIENPVFVEEKNT